MKKEFAKYIHYGMRLLHNRSKEIYVVVDTDDTLKAREKQGELKDFLCVKAMDYDQHELLLAWIRNKVHPEKHTAYRNEIELYRCLVAYEDVTPINQVRFITSDYKELFRVRNFDYILMENTEVPIPRQVVYYDEYHFGLMSEKGYISDVFHICQFAELCEKRGITVKPYVGPADGRTPAKLITSMRRVIKQFYGDNRCAAPAEVKECYEQGTYIVKHTCMPYLLWFVKEGASSLCAVKAYKDMNEFLTLAQFKDHRVYVIDLWDCKMKLLRK